MFIFLPAIPWHFYTQRPQHLAKALAKRGETVLYLCPTMDRNLFPEDTDDFRPFRLRPLSHSVYELLVLVDELIDIHQMVIPERSFQQISAALADFSCFQPVLFIQHPAWASLLASLFNVANKSGEYASFNPNMFQIVYDCMDDVESFPEAPLVALREAEIQLINKADKIFVTARKLEEKLSRNIEEDKLHTDNAFSEKISLIPNAVSVSDFSICKDWTNANANQKIKSVGYIGSLRSWFDINLVSYLLSEIPDISIALVGKVEGDFKYQPHERLIVLGQKPYEAIPAILSGFEACLIPFLKTPLTEATNPVKLYEYFAAGKPVVATCLPELMQFEDLAYLANSNEDFKDKLLEALAEPTDDSRKSRRIAVARENSWDKRASDIEESLALLKKPKGNLGIEQATSSQLQTWCDTVSRSFISEVKYLEKSNAQNLEERDIHWRIEMGRLLRDLDGA